MKLLQLVMIVKNSGPDIIKMLNNVRNSIDEWTILDTGSSDNTCENITSTLKNVPGNLYKEDFIDFATSRNRVLELAGRSSTFLIMLDDTYHLDNGKELRKFLKKEVKKSVPVYTVQIKDNKTCYPSKRILRANANIRYKYPIHEIVDCKNFKPSPVLILDKVSEYMKNRSMNRYINDIRLMQSFLKITPKDRHIRFHLAKTYSIKNKNDESLDLLNSLISEENKDETDYLSRYLYIGVRSSMGKDINDDNFLLDFANKYTNYIEPAYLVASYYRAKNEPDKAFGWIFKCLSQDYKNICQTINYKIINIEIPYLAADLAISVKEYSVAEKVLKKYVDINRDNRLINMVYAISDIKQQPGKVLNAPIVVIHASNTVKLWNSKKLTNKGSGSELMAIGIAETLTRLGYRVFIFGAFKNERESSEGMFKGVQYIDSSSYWDFLLTYKVNYLIVSREVTNLVYLNNVEKVFLWLHDILPFSSFSESSMVSASSSIQYHEKKFKKILCLCEWHKNFVSKCYQIPKKKYLLYSKCYKYG